MQFMNVVFLRQNHSTEEKECTEPIIPKHMNGTVMQLIT